MKRLLMLQVVIALVLVFVAPMATAGDPGIDICHVQGHSIEVDGFPFPRVNDFVITGQGEGCRDWGGKVIRVSESAWLNGHCPRAPYPRDCQAELP